LIPPETSSRSIPSSFGSATARPVTSTALGMPSLAGTAAGRFGEPRASRRRSSWNIWKRSSPSQSGRSKSMGDRNSRNTSRRLAGIEGSACSSSPRDRLSCRVMSRGRTDVFRAIYIGHLNLVLSPCRKIYKSSFRLYALSSLFDAIVSYAYIING
jgi:hypothetical protein